MTSLWLDTADEIGSDTLAPKSHFDTVVVGAGLTGLVAALLFARSGHRVAVLEARQAGAVTTGNTTAKVSLLQGARLQQIRNHTMGDSVVRAYVKANREGQAWLLRYLDEHGVPYERRDAVSYTTSEPGFEILEREYRVARETGLDVELSTDAGLPFATTGALRLPDQAQIDPIRVLSALAADLRRHGGVLVESCRVTGARASEPVRVETSKGEVLADRVIVATGTPILNRGLYWAKQMPSRSYAIAFDGVPDAPDGMYLSVDGSTRSIRTAGAKLLIGGNGHAVGRAESPREHVDELVRWTKRIWPTAEVSHTWSAQDYRPMQRVPFVGWMPRGRGRIYLATGYDKWGMTNAVQAALTLSGDILGGNMPWAASLHRRVTAPRAIAEGIGANAAVALWYARGWSRALLRRLPDAPPDDGQAVVGRVGLRPTGVSTVDGVTCRVSAVCTHMRAVLSWNDQELTWDCPAHGSRFAADGSRLEGPTVRDLPQRR